MTKLTVQSISLRMIGLAAIATLATSVGLRTAQAQQTFEPPATPRSQADDQARSQSQTGEQQSRRALLGIMPAPSRGGGVLVLQVNPHGPAAQAGVQQNDYILSINGKKMSSPEQLSETIDQMQPGQEVTLTLWRNGAEETAKVTLVDGRTAAFRGPDENAQQNDQAPSETIRQRGTDDRDQPMRNRDQQARDDRGNRSQDQNEDAPWIGVMLQEPGAPGTPAVEPSDSDRAKGEEQPEGAVITRIYPSGPASRAGIRSGDVIKRVGEHQITAPEQVAKVLEGMKPAAKVDFIILRNGEEQTIAVVLGSRNSFFYQQRNLAQQGQQDQFQQGFDPQFGQFPDQNSDQQERGFRGDPDDEIPEHAMMLEQHRRVCEQNQRLEGLVRELMDEVKQLRQDVQAMRGGAQRPATSTETPQ